MATQGLRGWMVAGVAGVAGLMAAAALAAPEDDYQAGVKAYNRGDVVAAMAAFRPPAQAGHAPSQVFLAFILDRSDFADEATALYRQAAAQDHAEGHAGLAAAFLAGRGVAKDEKAALQHFSKAADLGHRKSIEIMADLHLEGGLGLGAAPPAQSEAAVRRAATQGYVRAVEAMADAYRSGRWGLPVDAAEAQRFAAKATELKRARDGTPPPQRSRR